MKKIRNFVIGSAFIGLMFFNVNAETDIQTKNTDADIETITVNNATYTFKKTTEGTWQHTKSDIINGSYHTISNYEYANTEKACATEKPTVSNVNNLLLSCARIETEDTYLGTDTKYPVIEKKFVNGQLNDQMKYYRNSDKKIREAKNYRYYTNGKVSRYTKYYDGKKLSASKVSYNKTLIKNANTKGQITSAYKYEFSLLWNAKKANVRTKKITFAYYANGKVKERLISWKSAKYNTFSQAQSVKYNSNGTRKNATLNKYNSKGKITKKTYCIYNKKGELKSNKYGKAYRYTTSYKNGKKVKTYKYQYNAKGQAKRI